MHSRFQVYYYGAAGEHGCLIPTTGGTLIFDALGDEMRGIMKMSDDTISRKLTLKKVRER